MMPPEIYEAEYECSFESNAIGSIYALGLNKAEIDIDRKILADLAMNDIETFAAIAKEAKSQLAA